MQTADLVQAALEHVDPGLRGVVPSGVLEAALDDIERKCGVSVANSVADKCRVMADGRVDYRGAIRHLEQTAAPNSANHSIDHHHHHHSSPAAPDTSYTDSARRQRAADEPPTHAASLPSSAAPVSANSFASSANPNSGNVLGDRPTSRVLKQPGGDSTISICGTRFAAEQADGAVALNITGARRGRGAPRPDEVERGGLFRPPARVSSIRGSGEGEAGRPRTSQRGAAASPPPPAGDDDGFRRPRDATPPPRASGAASNARGGGASLPQRVEALRPQLRRAYLQWSKGVLDDAEFCRTLGAHLRLDVEQSVHFRRKLGRLYALGTSYGSIVELLVGEFTGASASAESEAASSPPANSALQAGIRRRDPNSASGAPTGGGKFASPPGRESRTPGSGVPSRQASTDAANSPTNDEPAQARPPAGAPPPVGSSTVRVPLGSSYSPEGVDSPPRNPAYHGGASAPGSSASSSVARGGGGGGAASSDLNRLARSLERWDDPNEAFMAVFEANLPVTAAFAARVIAMVRGQGKWSGSELVDALEL